MKIEMGESLFYSWLRHVKECQIVQTNWKVSQQWSLLHEDELDNIMKSTSDYFLEKKNYNIFKQNSSLSQIIQQGECDVVGISVQNGINQYYAVDVAFHEAGLNYGTKDETIMKVIAKSIRTAMCLYGYFDTKKAEIIFASPKINPAIMNELSGCIEAVNDLLNNLNLDFEVRIIANEEFNSSVLESILMISDGIADTSELFIRSYQMYNMFGNIQPREKQTIRRTSDYRRSSNENLDIDYADSGAYKELKIGQIARVVLRKLLQDGCASSEEINLLQQADYCKKHFDLQYPLLVNADSDYDGVRYYVDPVLIDGKKYMMCSQWFEVSTNNDRPYLLKWIEEHS